MGKIIIICPECRQKLRIPKTDRILTICCPKCGGRYEYPIRKFKKPKKKVLSIAITFIIIFIGIFFVIVTIRQNIIGTLPFNAVLFVNAENKTYFSPPLLLHDERDFLTLAPYGLALKVGYRPASTETSSAIHNKELFSSKDDDPVWIDIKRKIYYYMFDSNIEKIK